MSWIPESERDTAWNIFHREFMCKMSVIDGMTINDLEVYGMRCSGIPDLDQFTANELVTRLLPISKMAMFYQNGARLYICNPEDTKTIYELISAHLTAWKHFIDTSPIIQGDPPLEDLLLLDQFANSIYVHARWHLDTEWITSDIVRSMTNTLGISRTSRFGNKLIEESRSNVSSDEIVPKRVNPEYTSIANVFKQALVDTDRS